MAAPHSKLAFKAGIRNAIPTKPSLIIRHSQAPISTAASLMGLPRCLNEQAAKKIIDEIKDGWHECTTRRYVRHNRGLQS